MVKSKKGLLLTIFCVLLAVIFFYSYIREGYLQLLNYYLALVINSGKLIAVNIDVNNSALFIDYFSHFIYKILVALLVIWVIKAKLNEKILFTGLVVLLNYLLNVFQIIGFVLSQQWEYPQFESKLIINTISTFCLFFFMCFYIYRNKESIYTYFKDYVTALQFKIVLRHIFIVFTIALFIFIFFFNYFYFYSWIKVLYIVTSKVLAIMGYSSEIEVPFLRGQYGDISLFKSCLGMNIMLVYALVIYFTGIKLLPKLVFIVTGFIIFNLLNVIRFVLVFRDLQINRSYQMAVDVHDLYNYMIYVAIIFMWIVWFNKYSDIWPYVKKQNNLPENS